jgi:RimJ/RimL family protein N-acetyltransferase
MPSFVDTRTDRLHLTAVAMADLKDFHALHSNPALYQHAPDARHPDIAYSQSVLEGFEQDWMSVGLGYWTIRPTGSSKYLGTGGVRRGSYRGCLVDTWNVYYCLAPDARGRGYAQEVIAAAAGCVKQIEPGAVLQALMRPWNVASEAVAKKLGMTFCGSQHDHAGIEELVYQLPAADFSTSESTRA